MISIRLGVASVLLETLTLMSVGSVLAAVLSLFVLRHDLRLAVAASVTALVVGLPTIPPITRRLVRRLTARKIALDVADESSSVDQVNYRTSDYGAAPVEGLAGVGDVLGLLGLEHVGDAPRDRR